MDGRLRSLSSGLPRPVAPARNLPGARLSARAFALDLPLDRPVRDCFYLALAELHATRLVTADQRLVGRLAASEWRTSVTSVRDWAAEA